MKKRDNKGHYIKSLPDLKKNCEVCGKEYLCRSLWKYQTSRYCSRECMSKHYSIIKKGISPFFMTDEVRKKISKTKTGVSIWGGKREGMEWMDGDKNHNWKGDDVSYRDIHKWVERKKEKAKSCVMCQSNDKKMYHWANIDHKYKRNVDDYISLCPDCHYKYDNKTLGARKRSKVKEEL